MPIYEYRCEQCDETFETLVAISAADAPRECPVCGVAAPRIISACAIGASAPAPRDQPAPAPHHHNNHAHRSPIPGYARPCWMDDRSAERFAAYKMGRGAEYDDKAAAREEKRKQRGLPPEKPDNSHSPVAQALARKKAHEAANAASANAAPANSAPASGAEPRPSS